MTTADRGRPYSNLYAAGVGLGLVLLAGLGSARKLIGQFYFTDFTVR